jgi:hypothetical protein
MQNARVKRIARTLPPTSAITTLSPPLPSSVRAKPSRRVGSINTRLHASGSRATRTGKARKNARTREGGSSSVPVPAVFHPVPTYLLRPPGRDEHEARASVRAYVQSPASLRTSRDKRARNNYARRIVPAYYTAILPV